MGSSDLSNGAPFFTVIIPSYNRQAMLDQAIDSVLKQTLLDWELLVIDDSSPISVRVPSDPRVHLLRNATNLGKAASVNRGIACAAGKFIAFLDDDDLWTAERLEHARLVHVRGADLAMCGTAHLAAGSPGGTTRSHPAIRFLSQREWPRHMEGMGCVSVKREICPEFDTAYVACEDIDWALRVAKLSIRAARIDSPDFVWRRHGGPRHLNGTEARIAGSLKLLSQHSDYYSAHRTAKADKLDRIGYLHLRRQDRPRAVMFALKSILTRPNWQAFKLMLRAICDR